MTGVMMGPECSIITLTFEGCDSIAYILPDVSVKQIVIGNMITLGAVKCTAEKFRFGNP